MSLPAVEDTPSSTIIGSLSPCSSLLSLDDSFQTDFSHGLEIIPKLNKETELGIHNENKLSDIIPENISNENTTTKEDENDEQDLWEVKKIDGKKKFHGDWYYKVIWADGTSTWEPTINLENCPLAIREFEQDMRKKRFNRVKREDNKEKKIYKRKKVRRLHRKKAGRLPSDSEHEEKSTPTISRTNSLNETIKEPSSDSEDSLGVPSVVKKTIHSLETKRENRNNPILSDDDEETSDSDKSTQKKISTIPSNASKCYSCHRGPPTSKQPVREQRGKKKRRILKVVNDMESDSSDDEINDSPLLNCSKCCAAFHENCLPSLVQSKKRNQFDDYSADGLFLCHKCREEKICSLCVDSASTIELFPECKTFFRCSVCLISGHWGCVAKQIIDAYEQLSKDENTKGLDHMTANDALDEMTHTFKCATCLMHSNKIERILTFRTSDNVTEYLVKMKNMSYRALAWLSEDWIRGTHVHLLRSFQRTVNNAPHLWPKPESDAFPTLWTRVDKILDISQKNYLIKWMGLPHSKATWESNLNPSTDADFARALALYEQCENLGSEITQRNATAKLNDLRPNPKTFQLLNEQPKALAGGTLKPYQLDGLNWLLGNWCARTPCILADEMGLGKTIQVISFLIQLYHEYSRFPFLLVVPNSTLDNWSRELSVWSPDFLVVVSTGTREDREMIRKYDIFKGPSSKAIKSHIVLTSYESVLLNSSFKNVQWDCLIVDEGHRLKNNKSKLFTFLKDFNVAHKLLLTGTPLQNNIQELFNLMNFMDPKQFPDPEELAMKFKMDVGDEETKKKIDELHTLLRPHFLRRVKADVLKDMPAKAEILVPVRMTQLQKELIKDIYSSNFELLKALGKNAALTKNAKTPIIRSTTLMNILMQCRKVLSHPFLLPEVEEGLGLLDKPDAIHRRLVDSGGKLELLHQMLPKLKANGHKVLIFSQFKTTLDILEDYLTGSEWDYCRFDGDTTRSLRQEYIDTFNSSPEKFVFLLTTRAGGVGLNLTSADTVIIYDSDWNPHQDVQAIARCHRIGQTKPVLAFKFMTVGSVEEKMIAVGNRKMALDHVVVQKMKDSSVDEHDLVELLRYGAKALFEEDNALVQKYNDEDLDRLLDRSQAKPYLSSPPTSSNEDASDSPSSITPSNSYNGSNGFGFSKVWLEKKMDGPELETDEDNWEQLLNKLRKNTSDEVETQGRRKRKIVNYVLPPNTSPKKQKLASKLEPSNQSSESETSLLSLNEADSDTNDYVNEDELHSELSELLVQPSSKSMPSQPYLPPTDLNIQAQLKSDKTRAGMLGKPSESNGLSRARKVRRFGTKKFPLNSAKPPAGDFTNTQTHSPLVLATHQTTHVSTDSLKDSNISSNSHLSPDPHFTYLMPPPVPPPPPSGRLPQSAGGLTAYTFAQQSPCWICAGSIYSSISYHLPIQCPALQDRDFLISRLRAFYAHSPQTSRPAQFFLQKMIQRSSTLVCLICQSTFHHDTAHCPSNKNLDLLLATRHRILSTRQQNSSWIENFNQIEILLKLASKEQSLQRLPNQEK